MGTSLGRKTAPAHITLPAVRLGCVIDKDIRHQKPRDLPGPVIPVLARSLGPPSITNNLDCDQSILRHRQTAAVAKR